MKTDKMQKTAIIIGSSGGIGSAITQEFLKHNYKVYGLDIKKNLDKDLSYAEFLHYDCDVKDFITLQKCIKDIECNGNSVLIHCAGVREICPIKELSIHQWEEVFAINVSSAFVAAKTFAEAIKQNAKISASIITISSVSGLLGEPERTAYVASKHALLGLTKQLAIEYGKYGIRANAIAPGVIRTPMTEAYYHDPLQLKKIDNGQFINYLATPKDIAPLALFLASPEARFITGATMVADGGWSVGKNI